MKINRKNITKYLDPEVTLRDRTQFQALFIEELGWDYPQDDSDKYITIEQQIFTLQPIADKRGFNVFLCLLENQSIPLCATLKKIDREVSKYSYEHFIIYASELDKIQKWQWVKKQVNQPLANRIVEYSQHKKEALLQILETIYIDLNEEENLNLTEVRSRATKAFDMDKITKKFYDKFKKEHSQFFGFIQGITLEFDQQWYASLMLNRLMFVYFIQKKGFLNSDLNYLRKKLNECQNSPRLMGEGQGVRANFYTFYRYFLLRLFHDGLGSQNRTPELDNLLGKVPYLNGGLFEIHPLENKYPNIEIKDEAFEKIFAFFDQYNWYLDDRALKSDNEINPDVLGYIFEKYINQKQMGAYYTKEDITEYISKNCIIPYLFDAIKAPLTKGGLGGSSLFQLLQENPDRYIYEAVKKGINLPLPDHIAKGINDVSQRENWNQTADENYGLPTEIWREVIARRNRYFEVKEKLINGEITSINDLITYNLNIRQFAQDAISAINSPLTLKIFYDKLSTMSILDPTCGSGAFLFSALNILEPLYEGCLEKMEEFTLTPPTPLSQKARGEQQWEISPELAEKMKEIARKLRKESTPSEKILWEVLRNRQLCQQKFRKQHPIGVFVVDFYCHEQKLIIEIDGSIHDLSEQQNLDRQRQEILESLGLRFLRISSKQVETDLPATLKIIEKTLFSSPESNSPPRPLGEGAGGVRAKFQGILANVRSHSNNSNDYSARKYFILKNIILNNLYGVDIMEEATEVCKLRLFLKLASQITPNPNDKNYGIEPLPDIDFNIRSGNSLVGFANYNEVEKAVKGDRQGKLDLYDDMAVINDKAKAVSEVYQTFRSIQTQSDGANFTETKQKLQASLASLNEELNRYLAREYGIYSKKKKDYEKWLTSHQPFHWFTEFYSIINNGGFDVIIGNPPYLEEKEVDYKLINFICKETKTIHALCIERSNNILHKKGSMSMILPLSLVSTQRMKIAQDILSQNNRNCWYSNYSWRPSKLFDTVNRALTIFVTTPSKEKSLFTTCYQKFNVDTRDLLFSNFYYVKVDDYKYFWLPKINQEIELNILDKFFSINTFINNFIKDKKEENQVYYRTTGGLYWKIFTSFAPKFIVNGKQGHSTRETWISTQDKTIIESLLAILSSDLFWWWYTVTSNCRDLNPYDIYNFPVPKSALYDKNVINLGKEYLKDINKNSQMMKRQQKQTGITETQSFKVSLSKSIIEEIDKILAQHYGFSDEELDFIINYDIKYRMGKELDSD